MSKSLITPIGVGLYPRIDKPDTKFDTNGVYKVDLKLDTDDDAGAKFIERLDALYDDAFEQAVVKAVEAGEYKSPEIARKKIKRADKPYVHIEDEDGEETQFVKVRFKMKAKVQSRKTGATFELKPKVFDAHKQEMTSVPAIYSGSSLRVAFKPVPWYSKQLGAGVKLQLEAVQIIELVTGAGGGDADSYGFGDEDGYSYEAPAKAPFDDADSDAAETDDGSGDF